MTATLAEISDKMPNIGAIWMWGIMFSALVLIGFVRKWLSWIIFLVGSFFAIWLAYNAYYEAFIEPGFYDAIQKEMGYWWIASSIISPILPVVVAIFVLFWHMTRHKISLQKTP
jgi:hypothetical protein